MNYRTPKPVKKLSLGDLVDEFTDDEYELYLDADSYDKKATKEEKQKSVRVKRAKDKLERLVMAPVAEFIIITQILVAEGILTQERFDEIITSLS